MARVRPFAPGDTPVPSATSRRSSRRPTTSSRRTRARRCSSATAHNVVALELPEGNDDPEAPDSRYRNAGAIWRRVARGRDCSPGRSPAVYVLEQRYREAAARNVRRRAFLCRGRPRAFRRRRRAPPRAHAAQGPRRPLRAHQAICGQLQPGVRPVRGRARVTGRRCSSARDRHTEPIAWAEDDGGVSTKLWAMTDARGGRCVRRRAHERRASSSPTATTATRRRSPTVTSAAPNTSRGARRSARRTAERAPRHRPRLRLRPDGAREHGRPRARGAARPPRGRGRRASSTPTRSRSRSPSSSTSRSCTAEDDPRRRLARLGHPRVRRPRSKDATPCASSQLKPGRRPRSAISSDHSDAWKHLDVAVLQELVLDATPRHPPRPTRDARAPVLREGRTRRAQAAVGDHDVVFVMRATGMDQLRAVALAGETMPQKSTYFYPKLLSGLVLRSIDDPSRRSHQRRAPLASPRAYVLAPLRTPTPSADTATAEGRPRPAGTRRRADASAGTTPGPRATPAGRACRAPRDRPAPPRPRSPRASPLLSEPAAQEDAAHLDVVRDLTALPTLELDTEVPSEDLGRHDGLLAADAVERPQPLGDLEHVRTRRPDALGIPAVFVEQPRARPTRSSAAGSP